MVAVTLQNRSQERQENLGEGHARNQWPACCLERLSFGLITAPLPLRPSPLPSRNFKGSGSYVKSFLRKGQALLGLGLSRDAVKALEEGGQGQQPPTGRPLPLQHSRHRQHLTQCMPIGGACLEASLLRISSGSPCPYMAGLKLDPFNPDLKLALQKANQAVLKVGLCLDPSRPCWPFPMPHWVCKWVRCGIPDRLRLCSCYLLYGCFLWVCWAAGPG